MAGDWLKIRMELHDDPAVLAMARKLKTRPEHVVGYCQKFWSWVSRNTRDGVLDNVHLDDVESVLNLPHFCHMLREVGWLEFIETTKGCQIIVPKFDRHLSNSAKKRALDTRKKQAQRAKDVPEVSRSARDKGGTREEKRREDNHTLNSMDTSLDNTSSKGTHTLSESGIRTARDPATKKRSTRGGSKRSAYTDDFENFWKAYPKGGRQGKAKAFKAFEAALLRSDLRHLASSLTRYSEFLAQSDQKPKHCATWLNQECWLDEYPDPPGKLTEEDLANWTP